MPFLTATAQDIPEIVALQGAAVRARPSAFGVNLWNPGYVAMLLGRKRIMLYRDSTGALRGFILGERRLWHRDGQSAASPAFFIDYIGIDPTLASGPGLALTLRTAMDGIKTWVQSAFPDVTFLAGYVNDREDGWAYFGPAGLAYQELGQFAAQYDESDGTRGTVHSIVRGLGDLG